MTQDTSIQVVQDALAFTTAAAAGQPRDALRVAHVALAADHVGFLDALVTTVQALADELDEAGGDSHALLRDLGLGIQLAALAERPPPGRKRPPIGDHRPSP